MHAIRNAAAPACLSIFHYNPYPQSPFLFYIEAENVISKSCGYPISNYYLFLFSGFFVTMQVRGQQAEMIRNEQGVLFGVVFMM